MYLTGRQCQALVSRCLYKFLLDGTLKAYGVIMEDTVNTFQSQHYVIGCAFSLQTGISYGIAPLAGIFEKRVHPRIVASIGGFLAGLGFIGRAFLTSRELWQLFLCLSLSGFGFGLVNVITAISLKENFDMSYPTAYSVCQLSSYIGIAVMPPLLEYLQREYGEQIGIGVCGVLSWTLMLSGLFTPSGNTDCQDDKEIIDLKLLQTEQNGCGGTHEMQNSYQDINYETLNQTTDIEDCTDRSGLLLSRPTNAKEEMNNKEKNGRRKLWKSAKTWKCLKAGLALAKNHPELLILVITIMLLDYSFASWSIFLVPYGKYLGLGSSKAVWLSTFGGIAGLMGRLFCIALFGLNRMNLSIGLLMPVLLVASAYVISLFYSSFLVLAVVSSLSGFGLSIQGCTLPGWVPSCVCDYNFKTALCGLYVLCGIFTLTGCFTTGAIIDISGSYRVSFASLAVVSFIQATAVLIWLLCPYVPSPQKSASSRKNKNVNCCGGR